MCPLSVFLWRSSRHPQLGGDSRTDPELAVGVIHPFWTRTVRLATAHTVLMLEFARFFAYVCVLQYEPLNLFYETMIGPQSWSSLFACDVFYYIKTPYGHVNEVKHYILI